MTFIHKNTSRPMQAIVVI